MNTQRNMIYTAIVASCVIATTLAAGAEYLPPNKGYNYDKPSIPFPGNQPTPPTGGYRPPSNLPTKRPPTGYIPPPATNKPYNPPPTGPVNDNSHDDHHHHHEPGMPFDFSYAVNEDGNDYSHNAISDGDVTRGMYKVALPDGRTQVVKYTADWKNGFNAEVSYEGEAKYPDQPSAGYADSPVARPGQQYVPPNQGGGYQY